jgi:zinc transport system substrate-binding protein
LGAATAIALLATSCTSALSKSVAGAPVLSVATGLWPLAQAAIAIGGDKAAVVDVVPAGADPLTFQPDAPMIGLLRRSGLVLEMGGGFQPALERAAEGAPAITRLQAGLGGADPYVWLDPASMDRAVEAIADAMSAADPGAASLYQRNAVAYQDQVRSLGIDYSSTLSTCPGHTIVVPDGAFSAMAADYGLDQVVVGPSPPASQVAADRSRLVTGGVAALREPWVDDGGVTEVAASAGMGVHAVDTLAGPPATPVAGGGAAAGQGAYFARMEQDLAVISGALGCNPNEQ